MKPRSTGLSHIVYGDDCFPVPGEPSPPDDVELVEPEPGYDDGLDADGQDADLLVGEDARRVIRAEVKRQGGEVEGFFENPPEEPQ